MVYTLPKMPAVPPVLTHLSCIGLLLEKEPTNMQAASLSQLIDQGVARGSCLISAIFASAHVLVRGIHRHGSRRRCCCGGNTPRRGSYTASNTQITVLSMVSLTCSLETNHIRCPSQLYNYLNLDSPS